MKFIQDTSGKQWITMVYHRTTKSTNPMSHVSHVTRQNQVVEIIWFSNRRECNPMNSMITAHWVQMTRQAAEVDRCCSSLIIDSGFCHHSVIYCHLEANLEIFPTYQFVMTRYMLSNPVRAKSRGGPLYQYSAISMTDKPWAIIHDSYVWVTCMADMASMRELYYNFGPRLWWGRI